MCVGIPMQVRDVEGHLAFCVAHGDRQGQARAVSTLLLEQPPVQGDWLLVHIDVAIRATTEAEADIVAGALRALGEALAGNPFEHLIADLIEREPELPEHLRASDTLLEGTDGD